MKLHRVAGEHPSGMRQPRLILQRFDAWARAVAQSRWSTVALRVVLAGAGLVVLAFIGHSALARSAPGALEPSDVPVMATGPPAAITAPAIVDASSTLPAPATALLAVNTLATPETPIVLNQANLDDLQRLPGIGPKKAEAILALRQRMGRFRQVEDLLKVKGIGRATLKKLRPLVRIDTPDAAAP